MSAFHPGPSKVREPGTPLPPPHTQQPKGTRYCKMRGRSSATEDKGGALFLLLGISCPFRGSHAPGRR